LLHTQITKDYTHNYRNVTNDDHPMCTAEQIVSFQLWEVAGANRFGSLGTSFFTNTDIVFLAFDVNSRKQFEYMKSLYYESFCHIDRNYNVNEYYELNSDYAEHERKLQKLPPIKKTVTSNTTTIYIVVANKCDYLKMDSSSKQQQQQKQNKQAQENEQEQAKNRVTEAEIDAFVKENSRYIALKCMCSAQENINIHELFTHLGSSAAQAKLRLFTQQLQESTTTNKTGSNSTAPSSSSLCSVS